MVLAMVRAGQVSGDESSGGRLTDHIELGVLARAFPRDLLDEVLDVTGRREKRVRRLPAHVMIRYVIAQGLFFGSGSEEVMRQLVGSLRHLGSWSDDWQVPSTSAIAQARARLGAEPLRELFRRAAVPAAGYGTKGAWLAGLRLMSIDGTGLDAADTEANVAAFGRMSTGPKASAFPKVHVVTLSECGTHAVVAAEVGGCRTGERTLAAGLLDALEPDMLLLADAGFYSWQLWHDAAANGAGLLWRIGAGVSMPVVRTLPDGSYLGLLFDPSVRSARRQVLLTAARAGQEVPEEQAQVVRAVEFTVPDRNPDGELVCVITTVLDPARISATELAAAYAQRWEHESALDEIKTHLRGGGQVLRSKSPDMVEQEIYGLLLAHYGIRELMCQAADEAGHDPDRLSFARSVRVVRRQVTDQAAFPP